LSPTAFGQRHAGTGQRTPAPETGGATSADRLPHHRISTAPIVDLGVMKAGSPSAPSRRRPRAVLRQSLQGLAGHGRAMHAKRPGALRELGEWCLSPAHPEGPGRL